MTLKSDLSARMSFEPIRYSQVWEDHRLLELAFEDAPIAGAEVLSIASAGCNVLALLGLGARRIVAVDLSRSQLALSELKFRAALTFDSRGVLELLQGGEHSFRRYDALRATLSSRAKDYWDSRHEDLRSGLLHCGMLDKYFAKFREIALTPAFVPAGGLRAFGAARDLSEQRALYARADRDLIRGAAEKFFSREAIEKQGRDPEQFRFADKSGLDLGTYFFEKFEKTVLGQWIGDNPYLKLVLTGEPGALPYLTEEGIASIRSATASGTELVFEQGDLESVLSGKADGSIAAANLSDVFEYMSEAHAEATFELMSRKLAPAARIAFWNLLVDRRPSGSAFEPLNGLSENLTAQDRVSWLYSCFRVCQRT